MATTDLSQFQHLLVPGPLHFYYETQDDGTKILRHVRVNQHLLQTPTDVIIDGLPADSVGSQQIVNETIQMEDLSPEARAQMENQFATDSEVKEALGLA